jgi:N-acetylglucosaminyldiphosphoundecaprenol N-acetyl-beta-D-mannosaminyltransferase
LTHYLVGGSEECGDKFKKVFETMNPRVNFIGSYHGTCSENGILEDDEKVFNELSVLKPHMIWVGLGTPKQYAWIKRAKAAVEKGVFLAVGFAFDVNAGIKRDAPVWMQKRGLTWLFRMFSEPGRLPARYLKWNTLFIYYLMKEKIQRLAPQGSRQKIK